MEWQQLIYPALFAIGFSGFTFVICAIWEFENDRKMKNQRQQETSELATWRQKLGHRILKVIVLMNIIIYLAWQIPDMLDILEHYFVSNPVKKTKSFLPLSMVLNSFSHEGYFHLLSNLYMLYRNGYEILKIMTPEQFLAFYLCASVMSDILSNLFMSLTGQGLAEGLGASGVLFAILGVLGTARSENRLWVKAFLCFETISYDTKSFNLCFSFIMFH